MAKATELAPALLTLAELQNQQCKNCSHGVLAVIVYDPDAKSLDPESLAPKETRANEIVPNYTARCQSCGTTVSTAIPYGPQAAAADSAEADTSSDSKGGSL